MGRKDGKCDGKMLSGKVCKRKKGLDRVEAMATRDGVGREAPGAAAASCNSNKIVACEPDPRDCTCFFSYFSPIFFDFFC